MALKQKLGRSPVSILNNQGADVDPSANPDSVLVDRPFTVEVWDTSGISGTFNGGTVTIYKKTVDGNWAPMYEFDAKQGVRVGDFVESPMEITAGLSGGGGAANASVTITP